MNNYIYPMLTKYKTGYGKANGTFGELLQGVLTCQRAFMVTFPINLFSYTTFIPNTDTDEIMVFPEHKTKSHTLAKNLLKTLNIKIGGVLIIESELVEGKGLASSSADLVATAYAVSSAVNFNISREKIANLISAIEPSDGVMYSGIVAFDYKKLNLIEKIGNLPEIVIIAVDEDKNKKISTLEYNSIKRIYTSSHKKKYQKLLSQMIVAIQNQNLHEIGKLSTQSALMNQPHNPKNFLQELIDISNKIKGLGVTIAHSGTLTGIILDPTAPDFNRKKSTCIKHVEKLTKNISIFHSIDFNNHNYDYEEPYEENSFISFEV